ncbi:Aste57867_24756 [Aphanomyces stellatus]|uniref:Aste57867_24756 protein n=1 Tax=Aphanomyces stellatus TaxID=120398 RepID=A0A485LRB7_9STRA|nr:hypothetical protein As57867_024678 [Aphanomyces stellatus]VFU01392.1 Aste57867_24756 [Aphanomyces stellatus]
MWSLYRGNVPPVLDHNDEGAIVMTATDPTTVPAMWSLALDCVNTPLSKRVDTAASLLECSNPWAFLSPHGNFRSLLSTCSEVLQSENEQHISTWFFLFASAMMHLTSSTPSPRFSDSDESAVLRILRKVGAYMTILPVALGACWMFPVDTDSAREKLCEALEAAPQGREYIWEGLLRALNQASNLALGHVQALERCMSSLLARDSALIYQNDFQAGVFVDIIVRESTDLDIHDRRRLPIATLLRTGVLSPCFDRSGQYRAKDLLGVLESWRIELAREATPDSRQEMWGFLWEIESSLRLVCSNELLLQMRQDELELRFDFLLNSERLVFYALAMALEELVQETNSFVVADLIALLHLHTSQALHLHNFFNMLFQGEDLLGPIVLVYRRSTGPTELSKLTGVPIANLKRWKQKTAVLLAFEGNKRWKNLDGAGRPEEIPDTTALVAYMNKMRDNERALTSTHLVNFIKRHHRHWFQEYLEEKKRGQEYRSLLKLLQLFCARHGFTQQKPAKSKKRQDELEEIHKAFAVDFYRYDMPPNKIWAVRGGNSKISSGEKKSYRTTVVLGARANGEKLPILFIMRGQPGGLIERSEFESFPMGHFYAVQESAWMDERVWTYYLESLLKP